MSTTCRPTPHRPGVPRRPGPGAATRACVLALALLAAGVLSALPPVVPTARAQAVPVEQQPQAGDDEEAFREIPGLDINELRRMIRVARDAGFSDEQIRDITVEDENGNVVHALAYIEAYERNRAQQQAQREAERSRVYLSPKEILEELDALQPEDIDRLRERMLFVE